jgi:acetyl esterase/lipase
MSLVLRVSLLFSPRPAVLLLRQLFTAGGAAVARGLEAHTPTNVTALVDERYGGDPDEVLDVYRPAGFQGALPTVVWVHGGGWIAGSKEELAGYFKLIASKGYAVIGPRYSLAPKKRYPRATTQIMQVLQHLQSNAERLQLDPARIVIAGDSAGAQLTAQVAALVTAPEYADAVGVDPTIRADQLRGVVLACGPYDLVRLAAGNTPVGTRLVQAVLWAYSGKRKFLEDREFATFSLTDYVTAAFPPALITVGNADPLRTHSELLAAKLRKNGAEPDTLFFPADYEPPLGHEYQFTLDTDAAQLFLDRLLGFLQRQLREAEVRPAR